MTQPQLALQHRLVLEKLFIASQSGDINGAVAILQSHPSFISAHQFSFTSIPLFITSK